MYVYVWKERETSQPLSLCKPRHCESVFFVQVGDPLCFCPHRCPIAERQNFVVPASVVGSSYAGNSPTRQMRFRRAPFLRPRFFLSLSSAAVTRAQKVMGESRDEDRASSRQSRPTVPALGEICRPSMHVLCNCSMKTTGKDFLGTECGSVSTNRSPCVRVFDPPAFQNLHAVGCLHNKFHARLFFPPLFPPPTPPPPPPPHPWHVSCLAVHT